MSRSMSLCFLAVSAAMILMCAGSPHNQADDQYTVTAREMVRIYGDPSVSKKTKNQNLQRLADFYEKNRDRIQFNAEEKQWADQLLRKYKLSYVEGVPLQGGVTRIYITDKDMGDVEIHIGNRSSSASGVVIYRGTAIFGLAFIAACYIFKSKSL